MRLLLTGDKGFVGSNIRAALEPEYEVVGLEARERFSDWYNEMYDVMDTPVDAVVHAGAMADSQSQNPDIYLWNSYGHVPTRTAGPAEDAQYVPDSVCLFLDLLGRKHDGELGDADTVYVVKGAGGELYPCLLAARDNLATGCDVGR